MLAQRRHTRGAAAAAAAAAHAAAPLGAAFSVLPQEVLLALLSTLPLDALLRCGALNTAWAALLLSSPALFARLILPRLSLAPRRTPVNDDNLARLCARAGGALRALIVGFEVERLQLTAGGVLAALTQATAPGSDNPAAGVEEITFDASSGFVFANDPQRTFSLAQLEALRAACPALARGSVAVRCESGADGAQALSLLAGVHKCIDVSGVQLDAPALQALTAVAVSPIVMLRALNLGGCGIGAAGAGTLAAALNALPWLRVLLMSQNNIGDDGVAALAAVLAENTTVLLLDLRNNGITATGAVALAAALRRNASLLRCDLTNNRLASAGIVALAAAMSVNNTLMELRLDRSDVDAASRNLWDEAVVVRHTPLKTEWYCWLRVERVRDVTEQARAPRLVRLHDTPRSSRFAFHASHPRCAPL
jgi:hypothetical protein